MKAFTLNRLMQAGWSKERKINIDSIETILKKKELICLKKFESFLKVMVCCK